MKKILIYALILLSATQEMCLFSSIQVNAKLSKKINRAQRIRREQQKVLVDREDTKTHTASVQTGKKRARPDNNQETDQPAAKKQKIVTTTLSPKVVNPPNTQSYFTSLVNLISSLFFQVPQGMKNAGGNDCFVIASLQVLRHIEPLMNALKNNAQRTQIQNEFLNITAAMEAGRLVGQYDPLTNASGLFRSYIAQPSQSQSLVAIGERGQHDAHEFCAGLLGTLMGNEGMLKQLFTSNLMSSFVCNSCNRSWSNQESELFVSVEIPQNNANLVTLDDSLRAFTRNETLQDYRCECQNMGNVTKTIRFSGLPEILIISLKRFSFEMHRTKIQTPVQIPLTLTVSPYVNNQALNGSYNLIGIVMHTGTLESGHYRAYAKNPNSWIGWWRYFNDSYAQDVDGGFIQTLCNQSTALRSPDPDNEPYSHSYNELGSPYILFYQKKH
jgi:ubiquitin C-terminal hydrolase